MHLLSAGKSTILTTFENLETKSTYRHADNESTDFQFCAQTPIFVEVNKKSGIEILRVKEDSNQRKEIQRVRKVGIENVFCVAGGKQSVAEIGVGLSNGQASVFNYLNSEIVHKFNAENKRNSVLYLDFNASDEYMSSVLENGQINIYGIKTRAKIDTVNIDGNSTLARFHPTKRFHLSIASYKGTVSIYDVKTKRRLFHNIDAHSAPCRDLCMSPSMPDMLVSVGYDCLINIFDTRRKTQPLQLRYCHPLSTVALSECGIFFCVGNLKGELIAYDIRNPKIFLTTTKLHECAVTRIAFVPHDTDTTVGFAGTVSNASTTNMGDCSNTERRYSASDQRKSFAANIHALDATARGQRDSFCDFLDFQANKGLEKMSSRFITRRDSFDSWDGLHRKPNADELRPSLCGNNGIINSATNSANNSSVAAPYDSFDSKLSSSKKSVDVAGALPLRDRSNNNCTHLLNNKLVQIQEELSLQNTSSESDKENPAIDLEMMSRLQILPADRNSTPNRTGRCPERLENDGAAPSKPTTATLHPSTDFTQILTEMSARFQQLESELKFQMEMNKWHIFSQNFNLWNKQNQNNEAIFDALGILLQTDPFVNEFIRLKQENEELKLQLQNISKK